MINHNRQGVGAALNISGGNKVLPAQWDDLRFPVGAVRQVSGTPPADRSFRNGLVFGFDVGEAVTFNVQCPHKMKLGIDLDFHFHAVLPTAGAGIGAENAQFELTYSWADRFAVFPVETSLTNEIDVQSYLQYQHRTFEVGAVLDSNRASSGDGVSSMLICRFTRIAASANEYADEIWVAENDFHIQIDSAGSNQEYIK